MNWLFETISIILYLFLAFQDFKSREFYILLIPLLLVSNVLMAAQYVNQGELLEILKMNGLFIGVLLLGLYLVFAMREGSFAFPEAKIGWGDVLILFTLIPLFVPIMLKIVFLSTAFAGLVLGLVHKRLSREDEPKVPFAGLLAAICSVLIVLSKLEVLQLYQDPLING